MQGKDKRSRNTKTLAFRKQLCADLEYVQDQIPNDATAKDFIFDNVLEFSLCKKCKSNAVKGIPKWELDPNNLDLIRCSTCNHAERLRVNTWLIKLRNLDRVLWMLFLIANHLGEISPEDIHEVLLKEDGRYQHTKRTVLRVFNRVKLMSMVACREDSIVGSQLNEDAVRRKHLNVKDVIPYLRMKMLDVFFGFNCETPMIRLEYMLKLLTQQPPHRVKSQLKTK